MEVLSLYKLREKARQVNWPLLVFLLLVLNVKLVVKIVAILFISVIHWKRISLKHFFKQPYLLFYFSVAGIGFVNLLLQYKNISSVYLVTVTLGILFWMMSAAIAYLVYIIVQKESSEKIHATITVFFIAHITAVFINFLQIILETGAINPYAYKGLNQKYYISTGDFISGITFDAPVTTAFICAFALLYFFYRRQFIASIACMAALLLLASNFANLILLAVLLFIFIFSSDKIQKSFILIYFVMLIVFMAKVSPQNNEHVGRIFYHLIDKPYDLPKPKIIPLSQLKKEPDSVLTFEERKRKYAQNFIDSISGIRMSLTAKPPAFTIAKKMAPIEKTKDADFFQFHESKVIEEKINRYENFIKEQYSIEKQDSLKNIFNWKKPGKWIAAKMLGSFFQNHPGKILTGNGIGNFSSRLAFKATLLNTAGSYPAKLKYINNDFLNNHLYLYLYYHSQDQSQHEATNTPDAVYYQLMGEYGITGLLCLFFLYFGFFFRKISKKSFALPLMLLLAGSFFAEYWFEQFSIIILAELLFFIDIKDKRQEEQQV